MSTPKQNDQNGWGVWIAIVILFAVGLWPISLVLLARQLLGMNKKKLPSAKKTQQQAQSVPPQAPKAPAKQSARTVAPKGRKLTVAGAVVTALFGVGFFAQFLDALSWGGLEYYIQELGVLLGFVGLGLVLLFCGLTKQREAKRCRKYLNLIGKRKSVSVSALAKTTGSKRRKVLNDLQNMLDDGELPMGYLDLSRDLLILSEEGIPDEEPVKEPEPAQPQDDNAVLQEIREVNDAISDPVISAKIDRIGAITGKILDYQRRNPGKDSQLRGFLNYYLPTTLKILRSYAQLDAQGVEGENISAAKQRIEGMMDKVVEGFETQLDQLFRDSAMDISSDVAVLERMLEKDGLSGGQGMTL